MKTGKNIIQMLEDNYSIIKEEYVNLQADLFTPWKETELYDKGWSTYPLYFFGKKYEEDCARCPKTVALLEQFPEICTAGYSRLAPDTHILPHEGYTGDVLRVHLGIIVPEGDCGLKVDGILHTWEEGKAFVFDDTLTHEAWNNTKSERVVLLLDFKRNV